MGLRKSSTNISNLETLGHMYIELSTFKSNERFGEILKGSKGSIPTSCFWSDCFQNVTQPVAILGFNPPPPFSLLRSIWMWDTFQGKLVFQLEFDIGPMFTESIGSVFFFFFFLLCQFVNSKLISAQCLLSNWSIGSVVNSRTVWTINKFIQGWLELNAIKIKQRSGKKLFIEYSPQSYRVFSPGLYL